MRSPDALLYGGRSLALEQARARLERAQTIATTGLAQTRSADDPGWLDLATTLRTQTAAQTALQKSLASANERLGATDDALNFASEALARLQELATQGANDTYNAAERSAMATEVRQLKETARMAANTRTTDGYLFGGFATTTAPFDAAGAYLGDGNTRTVVAANGERLNASVDGARVFTAAGGVDVFGVFDAIANALASNDSASVRANLDDVTAAIQQVSDARAEAGDYLGVVQRYSDWLSSAQLQTTNERAARIEADPVVAYSELAQATTALDAALRVSSQAHKTLLDYL